MLTPAPLRAFPAVLRVVHYAFAAASASLASTVFPFPCTPPTSGVRHQIPIVSTTLTISSLPPASGPVTFPHASYGVAVDSRRAAADRRREAALAGLVARQMPLPGSPGPRPATPLASARRVPPPTPMTGARIVPIPPPSRDRRHPQPVLTAREVEVLLAWLRHDSKSEAAAELCIAPGTVNTHLSRIRAKYGAAGRPARTKVSLAARAIQDGLISLDEL